jgi:hypothetical protein
MIRNLLKADILKTPNDLRNLQEIMFDANESTRISLAQVLVHPWVQRKGL